MKKPRKGTRPLDSPSVQRARAKTQAVRLRRLVLHLARNSLPHELERWAPLFTATGADGVARIALSDQIVAEIHWDHLRATIQPPEAMQLIQTLYRLLKQQAALAAAAEPVIRAFLDTAVEQKTAGHKTAERRRGEWTAHKEAVRAEALKRWSAHPTLTVEAMATHLASRRVGGYRSNDTIADIIRDLGPRHRGKK